jgi:anti-anti-sigma factor
VAYVLITSTDSSSLTIHLRGDIDETAAAHLRRELVEALVHHRPARVLVDLRGVTSLDASAVGSLRAAGDIAGDVGVALSLDGTGSPIDNLLPVPQPRRAA